MRRLSAMFSICVPLLICLSALAADEPTPSKATPSKPIKQASAKEEASVPAASFISASAKEEAKAASSALRAGKESRSESAGKESRSESVGKESRSERAARLKEDRLSDELAAKIAEKLAIIRKERAASLVAPRPIVRGYAPSIKKPESHATKAKPASELANAAPWAYEGEAGPQSWGKLSPANAKCDLGERQSPIDIRDGIRVDLDPLSFDYKASQFSVVDNGHTIEVNMGAGNYINVSGRSYGLVQFHFHLPSEERVNGRGSEMVVHLEHRDGAGKLAIVALLIERGKAHPLIQSVWNNLPLEKNEAVNALSNIDPSQLLPKGREYYTYMGSMTTPPCSEGVLWLVMKETIEMSPDQIGIFSRLYPMNARPIQRQAGRLIKESN